MDTSSRDKQPTVVVVGDVLLDRWWFGEATRLAREAPTPVVRLTGRQSAPGGAGNVAANAAALGARVRLVGAVGTDPAGRRLRELLATAGVDVDLAPHRGQPTPVKTRVAAGDQIVARVDRGQPVGRQRRSDAHRIRQALVGADALIVADYGSGRWQQPVHVALNGRHRPPLLVVDSHDLDGWADLRPDLATPDRAEAFGLLGRPVGGCDDLRPHLDALHRATGAEATVVTLDRDGTWLLQRGSQGRVAVTARTRARPATEQCSTGAGDTFVAALTVAAVAGAAWPAAAEFAQGAADVVLRRPGTGVCRSADLPAADPGRVLDADGLVAAVQRARNDGSRVVLTNGCFDVLHRGHTAYLEQAAALGDLLIVAVNSDDSVRRLKGADRPVNSAEDRTAVLAALGSVDLVTVFDTPTPVPLLERIRPDVYVKGGDYTPQMLVETEVVERYGGQVRIVDYLASHSTTETITRMRSGQVDLLTAQDGQSDVDHLA